MTDATTTTIPLARPFITEAEIAAVTEVLRTPNLSLGPKLIEFEEAFAAACDREHAIACSSGTCGLHLLMMALGIGEGDEVITTPFSFVASSNCILMERATPKFVDIDPRTWNIDADAIEGAITPKTKAIIPVDVFGQATRMDDVLRIAESHKLRVVEDSCEALGTTYKGKPAGSFGDGAVFGFYPNKQITTGEGGMVLTSDDAVADLCRSLRNQGRDTMAGWLSHQRMGYNYRMSDIQCALGLAQLQRIGEIKRERSRVADAYRERLEGDERLHLQRIDPDCDMSWFVFVVRLDDRYSAEDRNRILSELRDAGVQCSNYFAPIHLQPFYVERFGFKPGDFPVCEMVAERTIALPFHHELTNRDIDRVCETLRSLL